MPWHGRARIPAFLRRDPSPPAPPLSEAAAADLDIVEETEPEVSSSGSDADTGPELVTDPDEFGVYRVYQYMPSYDPDQETSPEEFADSPDIPGARPRSRPGWWFGFGSVAQTILRQRTPMSINPPFLNHTTLSLMQWYYLARSSTLSLASIQRLVEDVILGPDFDREELRNFRAQTAVNAYDRARLAAATLPTSESESSQDIPFTSAAGWRESSIRFWVPRDPGRNRSGATHEPLKHITVGPVWHRSIMQVLKDTIQNPATGPNMHVSPFRLYWSPDAATDSSSPQPPDHPRSDSDEVPAPTPNDGNSTARSDSDEVPAPTPNDGHSTAHGSSHTPSPNHARYGGERLWGEVYVGDAMNREHEKIRAEVRENHVEPWPETVVAAILLYSDSTRLAQFGNSSLWPAYGWFGNWTKYDRGKPSSFATHHLAYIPSVSFIKNVSVLLSE